jgi:hypothetical protein
MLASIYYQQETVEIFLTKELFFARRLKKVLPGKKNFFGSSETIRAITLSNTDYIR